ncbi:MAG: amino acid permease [Dehalococcoidia bacterium]|nr:amino acid permease [Dehalococcoidia bacterium]
MSNDEQGVPPVTVEQPAAGQLQRRIGLLGASASGIGIVLGAGIYVLIGEAAGVAGNGVWLAFLVGALLAAGTGLAYAELTALLPEAGAASAYARVAFGPRVGFVTGWMDVAVNAVAAPAVALGFARYLAGYIDVSPTVIAVVVVLLCAVIVLLGVSETVGLASIFAAIEASGLIVVILVGLPHLGSVNLLEVHDGATGLLAAAALVFFAYEGFEEIATLSEEVRDPTRNIPRALLIAVAVTTVIYVLVAAVAVSVVPWQTLASVDAPLAEVVRAESSDRLADALSLIALFATFNTVLLLLATGPRAMYGMARRGMLPPVFGRVWARRGTPWVAIALATTVALVFALSGDIGFVAQVTNFAVFTLFVVVNSALIRLRMIHPEWPRPFRAGPSIGPAPLPALVGLGGAVALAFFMDRQALLVGSGALALGIALSFVIVRGNPEGAAKT